MALSPLACRTERLPPFAILETPQIYHHQRPRTINFPSPSLKKFGLPAIHRDFCAFSSDRHETAKRYSRSLYINKHKRGCYCRSIICGVCTIHAADDEKVMMEDDKIDTKTLYDMLGVSRKAEAKDIKAAYRQQVRRLHPDVAPVDKRKEFTTAFLKIHAAYTTLANPQSRAWYDLQLSLMPYHASAVTDVKNWGTSRAYRIYESPNETAAETGTRYPWAQASSKWKGRNWETDQCW